MNIFRKYLQFRKEGGLLRRDSLLSKLQGKRFYTEDDINQVFLYAGIESHKNPKAERFSSEAFAAEDMSSKIKSLRRLNGVGMVSAAAILMFQNPYRYAELYPNAWNNLIKHYGLQGSVKDHRSDFGVNEYATYLQVLAELAEEYGMTVADVAYVLSKS